MIKQVKVLFLALLVSVLCAPIVCRAEEGSPIFPVYGSNIKDGSYEAEMTSSSSMFRIVKAELQVHDGNMAAVLTLSGTGYLKLFMGTGEEALKSPEESFIPYVEDAEGAYTYTIPIISLNREFDCAAYSKKKEQWYDRKLSVLSSSLPEDAFLLDDGEYTMDIALDGGSGRATVASPAAITVSQGATTASVVWSSPDYDYMVVDGVKYLPVNTEGNSVFEIPISALDKEIDVAADTVAMSKPHEIAYTLTFHSDTLAKKSGTGIHIAIITAFCVAAVFVVIIFAAVRKQKKRAQND